MPGFLGGSSGSSGTGGEITFPKEFIDPVTKLRVSQPENLIDTDFEYGLQPTKWETVELINNTPSFFSKSGDTTIPGIVSISTNNGTREITVVTATDHGLAVGIPINVTGTKSVTADGSYVINSIPNTSTFTYLCKDEQNGNNSIEDLYTSIITGEFFQGSQIRISDAEGIITDAESISTLTVKTDSTHGFGLNTPFYFLNLNSTISQEFEASNTAAKSFDSSNSATAQTFDGSNTLSTFNIDWSNSATIGGSTSTISSVNTTNDTITVSHGLETFANRPLGTPLYYNVTTSTGYFANNPRGVVFLKTTTALNSPAGQSTFQVSEVPDGDVIDIVSSMTGTFQLANQARTFAGNNRDLVNEISITVLKTSPVLFDGGNQGFVGEAGGIGETNGSSTVLGYSDTILVSVTAGAGLDYYVGAMVRYSTTGSAASGLVNNETYFIASVVPSATPNLYNITIKALPTSASTITPSGGTGTQTFSKIGISTTRDIIHVRNHGFVVGDMVEYTFPTDGRFSTVDNGEELQFYFVQEVYDTHNIALNSTVFSPTSATGGTSTSDITIPGGRSYRVHRFTTVGTSNFVVNTVGTDTNIQYLIVGGGGSGGSYVGGGGGAGGVLTGTRTLTTGTFPVVVGGGGAGVGSLSSSLVIVGNDGSPSSVFGLTASGGGGGGVYSNGAGRPGGSGGGGGGFQDSTGTGGSPVSGQGNAGGNSVGGRPRSFTGGAGGGGAGTAGGSSTDALNQGGDGGTGISTTITGATLFFGGGGGGGNYTDGSRPGNGGAGGGGGGSSNTRNIAGQGGGQALNSGGNGFANGDPNNRGGNGGANTGGGGGGVGHHGLSGDGGSGIVILRYPITAPIDYVAPVATGGTTTTTTTLDGTYRVHTFPNVGTTNFQVQSLGTASSFEYLIVGGGGAGGSAENNQGLAGGGGAGGILAGNFTPSTITYSVVVGAGATGTTGSAAGLNGNPSSVFGLTALGGGAGGNWWNPIRTGGASGGGGGNQDGGNFVGGTGTPPQGNNGGNGSTYSGFSGPSGGGGGGGWGGVGGASTGGAGGPGGNGYASTISGSVVTYAAGGGGTGTDRGGAPGGTSGAIGISGFGNGASAPANRGGGGGAAGNRNNGAFTAGNGGSGVVIIRYPITVN
jgi:hypothetical protein